MLAKIKKATSGKPCSCPPGKTCTACKSKSGRLKPIVSVEGYKALPVPVKITTYKDKTRSIVLQPPPPRKPKVHSSNESLSYPKKRSYFPRPAPTESENQETKISQWYRKRQSLRESREITKQEREKLLSARGKREAEVLEHLMQREREILTKQQITKQEREKLLSARRKREAEVLEQLMQREREISLTEKQLAATPKVPTYPLNECPLQSCEPPKNLKKKTKNTEAKLCCHTQVVCDYAKQHQKRPLDERFSYFCYKFCCQFYCCLTFLMLVGLATLFFI